MLDFLFCYEHYNREVENDTLVMCELRSRGYNCELMHFGFPGLYEHTRRKGKARVVVSPWLRYDENVYHYLTMTSEQHKIVNLQWEQVYDLQGLNAGISSIWKNALGAYHLCWGKNSYDRLIADGGIPDRIRVCGAIQQDYNRKMFSDYYMSRDEIARKYGLDSSKKWILFVSSFAYATCDEPSVKKLAERFGSYIYKEVDLARKSQKKMIEWIIELLEKSDVEFIYRPHPQELRSEILDETVKKSDRFHVISDFSVKQWAKVSDMVDLWMSTSNAEIASMGVGYITVRPFPFPEELEVESMRDEHFVTDVDTFIRANMFEEHIEGSSAEEHIEKLRRFYDYDADKPAYVRTADFLESILKNDSRDEYSFTLKQKIKFGFTEKKQQLISFFIEEQIKHPDRKIIDALPLKAEIKKNMHSRIDGYKIMREIAGNTEAYFNAHCVENA